MEGSTTTECKQSDREQHQLAEKDDPKHIFTIPRAILPKPSLCDEIIASRSVCSRSVCRGRLTWLGSGGLLDTFIVPNNAIDRVDLAQPLVIVTTGTTFDHYLVTATVKFEALKSNKVYVEKTVRNVKDIDNKLLIEDIELFDVVKKVCNSSTLDEAMQQFNNLMALVSDKHAPKIKRHIRLNKTPWWEVQRQEMQIERLRA